MMAEPGPAGEGAPRPADRTAAAAGAPGEVLPVTPLAPGLDQAARDRLRRLAERLRPLLESDARTELDRVYGVSTRAVLPAAEVGTLAARPARLAERHRIDALLRHYERTHRVRIEEAVERLVREVAFTEFNRLTGVRMLEAAGLVRPGLPGGEQNDGFQLFRRAFPSLCRAQEDGGYRRFLEFVYDEANSVVQSGLFDRGGVHSLVRPSAPVLRQCVEVLTAPDLDEVWRAEEAMGWLYQYFTPPEQRQAARDTKRGGSQAPRNAYELAFRNQFYTPDYVVRWLTDNALGAVLRDAGYGAAGHCPLLLPPQGPSERAGLPRAEGLRLLDPACGSGHFLLYAFDVLLRAYAEDGMPPEAAAPRILADNLFGVDIDWRACQIAGFVLSLKARKLQRSGVLPRPHMVWAQPLPAEAEGRDAIIEGLAPAARRTAQVLWGAFAQAAEAGSLLRADEDVEAAVQAERRHAPRAARAEAVALGLARPQPIRIGASMGYWDEVAADVRRLLRAYWHEDGTAGNTAEVRDLFAADLSSGLDLLDVLRAKYHVVLMNPPFGDAAVGSREYIAKHYPKTKGDLYTAFVERGLQWLAPGGALGALGPRTAYFLKTATAFREEVVLPRQVVALADLGIKVLDTAKVEAAAIVVRSGRPVAPAVFFRSLKTRDKVAHLVAASLALRAGGQPPLVFPLEQQALREIPGSPFAYWVGDSLRRKFRELPPLEGHAAEVRQGLATADDGRFLRLWWEVPAAELGRGRRWVPFAKGGEYSPYWDDLRLVVDWGGDGAGIRAFPNAYIRNEGYYFRPGLTFPGRASRLNVRVLPADCIFSHNGGSMFPIQGRDEVPLSDWVSISAFLNSRVVDAVIQPLLKNADADPGSVYPKFEVGIVQRIPTPSQLWRRELTNLSMEAVQETRRCDLSDEGAHAFCAPALLAYREPSLEARFARAIIEGERRFLELTRIHEDADGAVSRALRLSNNDLTALREDADDDSGARCAAGTDAWSDRSFRAAYLSKDAVDSLPDPASQSPSTALRHTWLAGKRQKHRTIADLALLFGVHPSVIVDARRRLGLIRPEEFAAACYSLVSYCVGCAFGRWDVRLGQRAAGTTVDLGDPFAPLPRCSPGMLQDPEGLPLSPADLPPDYPLRPPLDGILVDDPTEDADIVRAVRRVLGVLFGERAPAIEDELRAALGAADLRAYLRQTFFAAHVKEYSGSQRQAPIYWQLAAPGRAYGLWLYYPRLGRDTLATALGKLVEPKVAHETGVLAGLQRQAAAPGATRAVKQQLAEQQALVHDAAAFRDALRAVAPTFDVDFSDGAVLNAAPLAGLMRWPKAEEAASALGRGQPAWSAAARRRPAR